MNRPLDILCVFVSLLRTQDDDSLELHELAAQDSIQGKGLTDLLDETGILDKFLLALLHIHRVKMAPKLEIEFIR